MNSSSNEVPANGPRDHFVTSPSDDVITVAKYSQEERKLPEGEYDPVSTSRPTPWTSKALKNWGQSAECHLSSVM